MAEYQKKSCENDRLGLRGEPLVEGDWKTRPQFFATANNNNVQFNAWLRDPSEEGKKNQYGGNLATTPIKVRLSPVYYRCVLEDFKALIDGKDVDRKVLNNYGAKRDEKGEVIKDGGRETISQCAYGRHPDGYLYIHLREKGRKPVEFKLLPDEYFHEIKPGSDTASPLTIYEKSNWFARGWLSELIDQIAQCNHTGFLQEVMTRDKIAANDNASATNETTSNVSGW